MNRELKINVKKHSDCVVGHDEDGVAIFKDIFIAKSRGYFIDTGTQRFLTINFPTGLTHDYLDSISNKRLVIEFDFPNERDLKNLYREADVVIADDKLLSKYDEVFIKKIDGSWVLTWENDDLDPHLIGRVKYKKKL